MKVCVSCQLPKEEEFNWRWKTLGIRAKICRECQSGHFIKEHGMKVTVSKKKNEYEDAV